jgi:hypothetical protein
VHPAPDGALLFAALAPGAYALAIDDPRFLPWRQDGVEPGSVVRAELTGSSALVLHVVARTTGEPIERFAVAASYRRADGRADELVLHDGAAPLPGGRLDGLVAGDYALVVRAPELGARTVEIAGLAAGETRVLALELGPGAWAAGRVLCSDGAPAAGTLVSLLAPAALDDSPASPVLRQGSWLVGPSAGRFRRELDARRADARGAFRFALDGPGTYAVAVLTDKPSEPVSLSFSAGEDQGAEGLELVLPTEPKKP